MRFFLQVSLYFLTTVMVALVLLQPHKSEGLSSMKMDSTIFGVSTDGGPLAKATVVVAVLIALVVLGMRYYS